MGFKEPSIIITNLITIFNNNDPLALAIDYGIRSLFLLVEVIPKLLMLNLNISGQMATRSDVGLDWFYLQQLPKRTTFKTYDLDEKILSYILI